jgi:hypothetical protein
MSTLRTSGDTAADISTIPGLLMGEDIDAIQPI